jgi:nitrite reductase/ring-hydroxylating ferredoxin subunit
VANTADLSLGKTCRIECDGKEILLCHTKQGYFAIDNLCTHAQAPLCEGKLKGIKVLCPLHGAAFDVRDGSALSRPATIALQSYPVKIEGCHILIQTSTN